MHKKISPFRKIRTDFFVYYLQISLVPKYHGFLAKRFLSAQDTGFEFFIGAFDLLF